MKVERIEKAEAASAPSDVKLRLEHLERGWGSETKP